jgi:hypothetical protein
LPSDATYDKTSGVSFVCDLNDNIAAPWPSKSYAPASTCNKSMAQMLNLLFSMESIFAYKVLLPLFTARTPTLFLLISSWTLWNCSCQTSTTAHSKICTKW